MLDPRDWFGGHDDDEDPVTKTLRYLGLESAGSAIGQGASAVGQAVQDVGSSVGAAVSPYLPQPSATPAPEDYSFAPPDNPLATGLAAAGKAGVEAYEETGGPLSPWSAPAFAPARAAYIAERALPEIGGEIGAAAGRAAAGPDAAPYFTVPESVPFYGGQDVGAEQVGRFIGSGVTDPLTYVGAAGAAAAGAPARRVAAELARGLPGVGEAELLGRGAVGAVRGLGSRAGEALGLAGNAERVAAADARMAAEGSTLAPGTFGALPGGSNLEARIAAAEARLEHAASRLEAADAMLARAADAGSAAELRAARSGYSPARSAYDEAAARVEQLREQRRMVSRDIEGAGYGRPVEDAGIDTSAVEREATSAYGGQPEAVPPFRDDAPRSISMNAGFGVVPEAPSGGAAAARRLSELETAGAPESTLQKWRALADADVADPAGLAERLRTVEMVTPEDARAMLGERPEYLAPVAQFLLDQRRKVMGGGMTARDVGKAYYMTLMSMRSTAQEQGALQRKLASGFATGAGEVVPPNPQLGNLDAMVNVHNGRPLGPIFTEPGPNGRRIVRPESAGAAWVWTDEGQRALNALDEGEFLPDAWEGGRRARLAFGSDTVGGNGALRPLTEAEARAGKVNLTNLPAFADELNQGIGALKAAGRESEVGAYLSEQAKRLMGIGTGKSPFIKQLLGFGDAVTIDAREINYWLSGRGLLRPGDTSPGANMARAASRWWGSERRVAETLQPRIQAAVDDLAARYPELTEGIDPADAGHILHHWIWDRSGGSSTAHTDVMASQRLAGTAGVVPDAVRPDRLASVNRVLGQGIASSVSGGVGAQVNQEMNPDDPLAGIKGFAAGALVPPLAARGGMALARRAGRSAELGSAARIGLGDVPPSRIRRPALPGVEPPYVREHIPDVPETPNRPPVLGDVPPSRIRQPELPGMEAPPRPLAEAAGAMLGPAAEGAPPASIAGQLPGMPPPKGPSFWEWLKKIGYTGMIGPTSAASQTVGGAVQTGLAVEKAIARAMAEGRPGSAGRIVGASVRAVPEGLRSLFAVLGGSPADAGISAGWGAGTARMADRVNSPVGRLAARALDYSTEVFAQSPDAFFSPIFRAIGEREAAEQVARRTGGSADELMAAASEARQGGVRAATSEAQDVLDAGRKLSDDLGFRGDPGKVGKKLQALAARDDAVGFLASFLLPFPSMTARSLKATGRLVPGVGELIGRREGRDRFERLHDQMVGPLGLAAMGYYATQGGITGSGPTDKGRRDSLVAQGWQPHSVLVGGSYVPTRYFQQWAPMLDAVGEVHDAYAYGKQGVDKGALLGDAAGRIGRIATDQVGLGQLNDLLQVLDGSQSGSQVAGLAARSLGRYIPFGATFRTAASALDPTARRPEGRRPDELLPVASFVQNLEQGIPGLRQLVPERQDLLGRPLPNPQRGLQPALRAQPMLRAFERAGLGVGEPPGTVKDPDTGKERALTQAQQARWRTAFGRGLRSGWSDNGGPTDRDTLEAVRRAARDEADAVVLGR